MATPTVKVPPDQLWGEKPGMGGRSSETGDAADRHQGKTMGKNRSRVARDTVFFKIRSCVEQI